MYLNTLALIIDVLILARVIRHYSFKNISRKEIRDAL